MRAVAARHGKLEAVKLLLQHKDVDLNVRVGRYWTALTYAKDYRHHEIVDLLLSHGAIDYDVKAPTTVPTILHINDSQNTTLHPDHEAHFDQFYNDMDAGPTEAWEELLAMEE
ncbi:hypothetical protein J4E83_010666 [Alternaria metachromatica]|uniref:uncharacterized protein n=1 Tax=Alternaria metachromatica TaxID=283354 RepID=UPI0020C3F6F0|nr:uncharacterized protein J4E83_010666 [Alternaria metachromatica]KAI4605315.1 hypothetical protein J4E83_010666 [Alternaria metachromatica]